MSLRVDPATVTTINDPSVTSIAGLSLRALAWRRLRRDKAAVVAMAFLILVALITIFTPWIVGALGLDPFTFDQEALDPALGSIPAGPWGGISWEHPLGVEPLTGRDIFARLLVHRFSLLTK